MKKTTKIISFVVAVALFFSLVVFPTKGTQKALAANENISTGTESVIDINLEQGSVVDTDGSVDPETFFSNATGIECRIFTPDSQIAYDWFVIAGAEDKTLDDYGTYSMQFRNGETYTDFFYLSNAFHEQTIKLEGKLVAKAEIGATVTLPLAGVYSSNGARVCDALIEVFDTNGNDVTVSSGETKTFTNKTNLLGNYYIKYTSANNENLYKYFTVNFSAGAVDSTKLSLVLGTNDNNIDKDTTIQTFKYYDLSNVYVVDSNGNKIAADISVTIKNQDENKYYGYASAWALQESVVSYNALNMPDFFCISDLTSYSSYNLSSTGSTIVFEYEAILADETVISKTVSKTEFFSSDTLSINLKGCLPSKLNTTIQTSPSSATQEYELPDYNVVIKDGYNETAILSSLVINRVVSASTSYATQPSVADGTFIMTYAKESTAAYVINVLYKITYYIDGHADNTNTLTKLTKSISVDNLGPSKFMHNTAALSMSSISVISYDSHDYTYDNGTWNYDINSISYYFGNFYLNGEVISRSDFSAITYNANVYTKDGDVWKNALNTISFEEGYEFVKPNNLTVGTYKQYYEQTLIDNSNKGQVKLPSASAKFYYTPNASIIDTLTKYNFKVYVNNVLQVGIYPESEIELSAAGEYKIKYVAVSNFGATREIEFSIYASQISSLPTLEAGANLLIFDNETEVYDVDDSLEISGAFIIDENGEFIFPSMTYSANTTLSSFKFDYSSSKTYRITLVRNSSSNSQFISYVHGSGTAKAPSVRSISLAENIAGNVLVKNGTVSALTGATFYVKNLTNFTISGSSKKVSVNHNGCITFFEAGSYTVVSGEDTYSVTITSSLEPKLEFESEPVSVIKKGETLNVLKPYIENFAGYSLEIELFGSNGTELEISDFASQTSVDSYVVKYSVSLSNGKSYSKEFAIVSGNTNKPTILISAQSPNVVFGGSEVEYEIKSATAVDKNGVAIANVMTKAFGPDGKELTITNGKIKVSTTGTYTIYYSATDGDGIETIEKISFTSAYASVTDEAEEGLSAWAIVGIVAGSIVAAALATWLVLAIIKKQKSNKKFATRVQKKKSKEASKTSATLFTIAPSKDQKIWFVKKNGKMIGKCKSKIEAVDKAKAESDKNFEIKVYNQAGRLIDSIK